MSTNPTVKKIAADVASRDLRWLASQGRKLTLSEATEAVKRARFDLLGKPYKGGAASDFVQRHTRGYKIHAKNGEETLFEKDEHGKLVPVARNWERDWRSLYAPGHGTVRMVAAGGLLTAASARGEVEQLCHGTHYFVPRDPSQPSLDLVVGSGADVTAAVATFAARRAHGSRFDRSVNGVYFHTRGGELYIGKTDEVQVRERIHRGAGQLDWLVFMTTGQEEAALTNDEIMAAEALLITFWREVADTSNTKGGCDKIHSLPALRSAVGLATATAAALLRLHRDSEITIPLKSEIKADYGRLAPAGAGS